MAQLLEQLKSRLLEAAKAYDYTQKMLKLVPPILKQMYSSLEEFQARKQGVKALVSSAVKLSFPQEECESLNKKISPSILSGPQSRDFPAERADVRLRPVDI